MPKLAANLIDELLESSILFSFSKYGFEIRKDLFNWNFDLSIKPSVVVVTGASSGLGLCLTKELSNRKVGIIGLVRDLNKTKKVFLNEGILNAELFLADFSEPDSVSSVAQKVAETYPQVDAVIHNAGALNLSYVTNSLGIESTFATQVIGPWLFNSYYLGSVPNNKPVAVINVTSGGMYTQSFDPANIISSPKNYKGSVAYARSKRAQVIMQKHFASLWPNHLFYSMHPGWVDTPGLASGMRKFYRIMKPILRTPYQGIDTILYLLAFMPNNSGALFFDRKIRIETRLVKASTVADPEAKLDEVIKHCLSRSGWNFALN